MYNSPQSTSTEDAVVLRGYNVVADVKNMNKRRFPFRLERTVSLLHIFPGLSHILTHRGCLSVGNGKAITQKAHLFLLHIATNSFPRSESIVILLMPHLIGNSYVCCDWQVLFSPWSGIVNVWITDQVLSYQNSSLRYLTSLDNHSQNVVLWKGTCPFWLSRAKFQYTN